jgi:hypothetical protein
MLEFWFVKTLFGLCSKIAANNRIRLGTTHQISVNRLRRTIKRGRLLPPDGLYVRIPSQRTGTYEPKLNLIPLSVIDQEVVGLRCSVFGFAFDFPFDASNVNIESFRNNCIYRPGVFRIKKGWRCHTIVMTGPKDARGDREITCRVPTYFGLRDNFSSCYLRLHSIVGSVDATSIVDWH